MFVRDRAGPAADGFDVGTLDTIYDTHLRPTLDALEPPCKNLARALFRNFSSISYVKAARRESSPGSLLERRNWERTRDGYIVEQGFRLADECPIELRHCYNLTGYTGRGNSEFDVVVVVIWRLGGVEFSRGVVIGGTPVPQLDTTIPYSALDARRPDIDHTVAEVMKGLMHRIAGLSDD